MFTQEQIDKILEDATPNIVKSFTDSVTNSIDWDVQQKVTNQIGNHVSEWIKENVIPEITKNLVESKDGLISLGIKIAPAIIDLLTKSAIEDLGKKLEQGWERRKIFEALFK